ncbi:MAG: hypothetical protein ABW019_18480, partial [Chitinophagaceae bacterium]
KGADPAIAKLSLLVKQISQDNKAAYLNHSDNTDSTVASSFELYNFFIAQSANPSLVSKIEAGRYSVFFVSMAEGFPLMTFCLVRQGNNLLNHTAILYHPATVALVAAVNQAYEDPDGPAPSMSVPVKNTRIGFDTLFSDPQATISFYFDLISLNANCDSLQGPALPEATVYCNAITALKNSNLSEYYLAFAEKSQASVETSLTGISNAGMEYYKNYQSAYSFLAKAIDLGPVKLLLVSDPRNDDPTAYRSIYLGKDGRGAIKWMNANHEFYLDDLLRTPEFRSVLSGPAARQPGN